MRIRVVTSRLVAAAEQRLDSRQQFAEREGLGEVVVAAGAQALDAVVHRPERREDQHRGVFAVLAQHGDDGQAVEVRQLAVGDDEVVAALGGAKQAFAAVGGDVHHVAAFAQALGQEPGGFRVVLDQQQVHWVRKLARRCAASRLRILNAALVDLGHRAQQRAGVGRRQAQDALVYRDRDRANLGAVGARVFGMGNHLRVRAVLLVGRVDDAGEVVFHGLRATAAAKAFRLAVRMTSLMSSSVCACAAFIDVFGDIGRTCDLRKPVTEARIARRLLQTMRGGDHVLHERQHGVLRGMRETLRGERG